MITAGKSASVLRIASARRVFLRGPDGTLSLAFIHAAHRPISGALSGTESRASPDPGGIVIALDLIRASSVAESTQIDSLMDLYFGAGSGSNYGLWIKSATGSVTAGYVLRGFDVCSSGLQNFSSS
jgi:hypothetical protein